MASYSLRWHGLLRQNTIHLHAWTEGRMSYALLQTGTIVEITKKQMYQERFRRDTTSVVEGMGRLSYTIVVGTETESMSLH